MDNIDDSAIARLVRHHGGPVATARLLGDSFPYQEIQRWLRRGWASPMHILRLKPHLPKGMRVEDLYVDRGKAKAAA